MSGYSRFVEAVESMHASYDQDFDHHDRGAPKFYVSIRTASVFHLPPLLSLPSYEWKPLQVIAGKAKKDDLQDVLTMVRNASNPQVNGPAQTARLTLVG